MSTARPGLVIFAGMILLATATAADNAAKKLLVGDTKVDVLAKYQGEALPRPDRILIVDFKVPPDAVSLDDSVAARLHGPRHHKAAEQGKAPDSPEAVAKQVQSSFSKSLVHELQQASLPVEAVAADAVNPASSANPASSPANPANPANAANPPASEANAGNPANEASAANPPSPASSANSANGAIPANAAQATPGTLVVQGDFTLVDQGNKTKRLLIGFGKGASDVQAHVTVSRLTANQPLVLLEFKVQSKSGKKPGAAATVGAGAATLGTVSAGSAAAGMATGGVLDRSASVQADAARMAKSVAKQIVDLMNNQQTWSAAPSPAPPAASPPPPGPK